LGTGIARGQYYNWTLDIECLVWYHSNRITNAMNWFLG